MSSSRVVLTLVSLLAVAPAAPAAQGDPLVAELEATLLAEDGAPSQGFGSGMAVWGDTVVAGSGLDDELAWNAGSAYVFVRSGTTWTQQAKLLAPDGHEHDYFGDTVAISGDTIVVGAPGYDEPTPPFGGTWEGAVYVFVRTGTSWTLQSQLKSFSYGFGNSVAIFGDTLLVGAPEGIWGQASIFVRSGTSWSFQANLQPAGLSNIAQFGCSVAVQGDTALVGARLDYDSSGDKDGSAYVFTRSGTLWTQQAKLTSTGDEFGWSVALSGDTALIGAPGTSAGAPSSGAAYVFVRNGTSWTQQAKLGASDPSFEDHAGKTVALRGGLAVIGASEDDSPAGPNTGSAYVWVRGGTSWTQRLKLTPSEPLAFGFGAHLAVVGDTLLVVSGGVPATTVAVYRLQSDWTEAGLGLAGVAGVPTLAGSGPLVEGLPATLTLQSAAPLAPSLVFASLASMPAPFKGGTLHAFPPAATIPVFTSATGGLSLGFVWPAGVPSGTTLWFQCAIADAAALNGVSLSNASSAATP